MQHALTELLAGRPLGEAGAAAAIESILAGRANESQVGAFLALVAARGATADELVGAGRVMRRHAVPVPVKDDPARPLLDTCGTGGAPKAFNISTAAAIVAASVRTGGPVGSVRVAKHGGRSRTGRGAAEVLALLGVNIDATPEVQARCLDDVGLCFSFAVNHHPAMRFAAAARKSLGFPTIFNLLGPLTNPAGAKRQLMGVWEGRYCEVLARALLKLGGARAWVVNGLDGMDEMSTCEKTFVVQASAGDCGGVALAQYIFDARTLGIAQGTLALLCADSAQHAADLIRGVLGAGDDPRTIAARDIVALNAAAALIVGGVAGSFAHGMALAREALASGAALCTLHELARRSHG